MNLIKHLIFYTKNLFNNNNNNNNNISDSENIQRNNIINSKTINLRTPLNTAKLKKYIKIILINIDISQYVIVQTKLMFNKNNLPTYSLGKKYYLNLNKNKELNEYVNYVANVYNNNPNVCLSKRVTGIYLSYEQISKQSYINFKNKIK